MEILFTHGIPLFTYCQTFTRKRIKYYTFPFKFVKFQGLYTYVHMYVPFDTHFQCELQRKTNLLPFRNPSLSVTVALIGIVSSKRFEPTQRRDAPGKIATVLSFRVPKREREREREWEWERYGYPLDSLSAKLQAVFEERLMDQRQSTL